MFSGRQNQRAGVPDDSVYTQDQHSITLCETHIHNLKVLIDAGSTIDAIRLLRQEEGLSLSEAKRRVDELTRRSK